jgi:hypothetical protein
MLTVLLLTMLAATTSLVLVAPAVPRVELQASPPNSRVVQTTPPSSAALARSLRPPGRTQIEAAAPMQVCPSHAFAG